MSESSKRFKKVFLWAFGAFVVLILGLIALSFMSPDRPFTYVLQ